MMGLDWLPVRNTTSETIPSFGVMKLVGSLDSDGNIDVGKPDADNSLRVMVNGETMIRPGEKGKGHFGTRGIFGYDQSDGTPNVSDNWGVASGSWVLRKGKKGWVLFGGGSGVGNGVKVGGESSGGETSVFAFLTSESGGYWKWYPVGWTGGGWFAVGSESATFNAKAAPQFMAGGLNGVTLHPENGLVVRMFKSDSISGNYEFQPIGRADEGWGGTLTAIYQKISGDKDFMNYVAVNAAKSHGVLSGGDGWPTYFRVWGGRHNPADDATTNLEVSEKWVGNAPSRRDVYCFPERWYATADPLTDQTSFIVGGPVVAMHEGEEFGSDEFTPGDFDEDGNPIFPNVGGLISYRWGTNRATELENYQFVQWAPWEPVLTIACLPGTVPFGRVVAIPATIDQETGLPDDAARSRQNLRFAMAAKGPPVGFESGGLIYLVLTSENDGAASVATTAGFGLIAANGSIADGISGSVTLTQHGTGNPVTLYYGGGLWLGVEIGTGGDSGDGGGDSGDGGGDGGIDMVPCSAFGAGGGLETGVPICGTVESSTVPGLSTGSYTFTDDSVPGVQWDILATDLAPGCSEFGFLTLACTPGGYALQGTPGLVVNSFSFVSFSESHLTIDANITVPGCGTGNIRITFTEGAC